MENPVGFFEIYVDEIERAKNFYETLFDVHLEKIDDPTDTDATIDMYLFPADYSKNGASGALVRRADSTFISTIKYSIALLTE